jgi:hypothetical protein
MHAVPSLHEDLAPLAFLLGTWRGGGTGDYPTIRPFRYGEEMIFEHVGDPFLLYAQRSWLEDDGTPLHFERGFLRPVPDGRLEVVLAHPLGLTEVAEGTLEGTSFSVTSCTVGRTATGDPVTGIERRLRVEADVLRYELDMALETTPLTQHLTGELRRA